MYYIDYDGMGMEIVEEVNRMEAKRIQKAINRIEANEKALSRYF